MIYIIGSGPSGVAAAVALVKRGLRPTILDAGVEADLSVTALKTRLASVEPEDWSPEDLAGIKEMGPDGRSGIPRKLYLGSDFPYRDVDPHSAADAEHVTMLRSFARGGFSNVWGGAMQPLSSADFVNWPIGAGELAPHYAEVRKMMDLVLDGNVRASAQSQAFYDDLERHQKDLDREGIHFDYARLAVRTTDVGGKKGCRYCGLCLYGCPYDAIFNAANVLRSLVLQGNVSYVSGVIVDRIALMNGQLRIEARSTTGDGVRLFEAGRVFLAAGVLETARIALNSRIGKARYWRAKATSSRSRCCVIVRLARSIASGSAPSRKSYSVSRMRTFALTRSICSCTGTTIFTCPYYNADSVASECP